VQDGGTFALRRPSAQPGGLLVSRPGSAGEDGSLTMSLVEKLPGLADAELASLHANAVRLGRSGTARQRASAAELLPAIEAELASRRAAKQERLAQGRRERSKQKAAASAATAAA
jgi:hypothetical protein